jgi:hypothetical protein
MSSLGKKKYKGGMEKGEIRKKMDKEQRWGNLKLTL